MQKLQTILFFFCAATFFSACMPHNTATSKTGKVDMFMGVQGNSNGVIGPQLPHGSVNPSPQTPHGSHDGYAPNQPIRGFGQLHVSGTGWGRYGQILLSPQTGFNAGETAHDSPKSNEIATPYYYSVCLNRYRIKVEITPAQHCAAYRFTFPETDSACILLDIAHNIPQHIAPEVDGQFSGNYELQIIDYENAPSIVGFGEYAGGFGSGEAYRVYFAIVLNCELQMKDYKQGYARIFLPDNPQTVDLQISISMKSIENALAFLKEETGGKSFDDIKNAAMQAWENVFNKIAVKGGTDGQQRLFYTVMYHSYLMPHDRTGDHPHWDSDAPHIDDHYCVWDTWRTKYPLMTLLNESFTTRTIASFIDRYEHNGQCMPTFTSSLEWDWKQGGDDVDNIIADAFVKNVPGFDHAKAFELLKHNAFNERSENYRAKGWESEPAERMSCSYTMEYAYNDFCASEAAKIMKDTATENLLMQRSRQWVHLFNPDLESDGFKGFIAPRRQNGEFIAVNPAKKYGSWVEYFYEGNSWVYTLFVPHDFERLIALCGGKEKMIERLIYGFDNQWIDLSNEPGFLAPFIFTHCGRPDLAAKTVNEIRMEKFSLTGGYPGNEDSGAMGAWYVWTSIGLFPNAGQDFYYLLPPAFDDITITRENGAEIHIKTERITPDAQYIQSVRLNGKKIDGFTVKHADIAGGAELIFTLK
ncbi:MAG: GH92 family glycosyl hydrolase [Prevotellaceae bacterium]|jgi:predicted alpha-1,2-mannosidase|nr:GH92 family glycosyl hydrolase [Prevotellaceae bacterium]